MEKFPPAGSINELAQRLLNPDSIKRANDYFETRYEVGSAIWHSVNGTTFRAYRKCNKFKPSSLYRTWAQEKLKGCFFEELGPASRHRESYQDFHRNICADLQRYWALNDEPEGDFALNGATTESSAPDFGKVRKLIDLLMKHVLLVINLESETRNRLRSVIHVPLDRFTLKHVSGFSRAEANISLPTSKWSMGTVNEENYLTLQNLIAKATEKAGVAPIDFDILAWNAEHPNLRASTPAGKPQPDPFKLIRKK